MAQSLAGLQVPLPVVLRKYIHDHHAICCTYTLYVPFIYIYIWTHRHRAIRYLKCCFFQLCCICVYTTSSLFFIAFTTRCFNRHLQEGPRHGGERHSACVMANQKKRAALYANDEPHDQMHFTRWTSPCALRPIGENSPSSMVGASRPTCQGFAWLPKHGLRPPCEW